MFKQFIAGSCYSYILSSKGEALVIDPHISLLDEYSEYLKKNRLMLKFIIDTHTHADHFSLASVLKKKFGAQVLMHEKATSSVADRRLKDNEQVAIGSSSFKVIYTPGHTDDAISLYGENKLFSADVLLIGSVGRTDFQNGSPESMFDTLQKLKALPRETVIFPGHDYNEKRSSTLAKEKGENPFLKEADKETFVKNMRSKVIPKPFNIDNIIRVNQKGEAAALEMIAPRDALVIIEKDPQAKLLDVRSALEFSEVHIKNSINIPIDMFPAKINDLSQSIQSYIVLCRTGNRSPMAADMLIQSGIHGVKVMQGGMTRWQKEGLPVIKGEGGISLERQVRLIAGILVLLGIILSWIVHWAFIFIPVFVSCGLIFAGLTDNCLMGMLLMKLPYNKKLYKTKIGGGTCAMGQ
ncbi:MAG: MBL fold metallo-hydrolase [Candidatus Omnitrophica bacterium]|nr:MBL fold metallo-hydrolase [Candidatus Portnoybacteria bacterium]MDD5027814.1 MBL fold metallo-hydrolase [Candidatus Omnitrophota bacterium]MDD5662594.1 MBL fold metallo-hydrolase [Candidatus Omnitrophota bacterium]